MNGKNAYAAILAGGSGTRMGNTETPKQFLMLGDKPILIHTVEKFCISNCFDAVIVLCPESWIRQTKDLLKKHCPMFADSVVVTAGGSSRNETVMNAIDYVESNFAVNDETILVTHDAVRPFLSYRIIVDNIDAARRFGACDTVIPATDTIVESRNAETISSIPDRRYYYQGQTPQSFNLILLKELIRGLSDEEKAVLTDACKIFILRNKQVALVRGDSSNMKITYPQDMRLAQALLEEQDA